jgi:glyoxylase-like metal-dependent hydrolase (beta-lactamase superfamily II)
VPDVRVIPFLVSELRLPRDERAMLGVDWWPSYGHAVIHPGGVFLFDNGAGTGNAEIAATFSPRVRPIEDALAEHGISMADVTGAANCHLHFDHSGQNWRLPKGLPIFVQRDEWAMVHEPDYTVPEWIDVPGLAYELLDGETEVAPGLRLIPTPGHAPGHQSLVVDGPDGTVVILAGQAIRGRAEWEGATGEGSSGYSNAPDHEAYARSVERLRALRPSRVHFAHDPAIWER